MKPYVTVTGGNKIYHSSRGDIQALRDINLTINNGEFLSIVGPSGCGKSTLLRCVAGLEKVTSGSVAILSKEIDAPPAELGMVFQRDVLLDWRTVIDNVLLPVAFRGENPKLKAQRASELLGMFDLQGFERRYPWELSGGMRQRVAICRALLDDPALLLMDEPFGALDALTRDELNLELQNIWYRSKKTVLFITHGISEAVFLSDRVAVMKKSPGEIVEIIDVDLPRPRTLAVRDTSEFTALTRRVRVIFEDLGIFKERAN